MSYFDDAKTSLGSDFEYSGLPIVYKVWNELRFDEDNEKKFFRSFVRGFKNRPSVRISNSPSTIPDPLVMMLLNARIKGLSMLDFELIKVGHRVSMTVDNVVVLILEEYIHEKLISYGWSACWGSCIKAVDFCSYEGSLIQVKNKSNTENSSSNKIRVGTDIKKWYRFNASNGESNWKELNKIVGNDICLSEEEFQSFAIELVKNNPSVIGVSQNDTSFLNSFDTRVSLG